MSEKQKNKDNDALRYIRADTARTEKQSCKGYGKEELHL